MTTLYSISEQVLRLLYGGVPSDDAAVSMQEVKILVNQTATIKLKAQFYERLQMDDYSVPACMIASYMKLPIEINPDNGTAYTKLPAQPISLPLDMGVYEVVDSGNVMNDILPLRSGQERLLGSEIIKRQNWYTVENDRIRFSDSVKNSTMEDVDVKLLVNDLSKLTDYDIYPVPPDIEAEIIMETLNILRQRNPTQDTNNNSVDEASNG